MLNSAFAYKLPFWRRPTSINKFTPKCNKATHQYT
jgi:hypothetical protein